MLNTVHPAPSHVANFIVLLAKHYLYVSRCKKESLSVTVFYRLVNANRAYEKYKAIKDNKLSTHCDKWFVSKVDQEVQDDNCLNKK